MSKVKFNADEMMVMAMFEQPTRTETMRYIEEVVPFVEDDVEVFSLVASTMKKMRSISDMEFSRLDLKPFDEELVHELIKRIYVGMDNSVEVEFKCSDPYQEVLAIMSEVQNE